MLIPFVANPVPAPIRQEVWSLLPGVWRGPWELRKGSRSAYVSMSPCAGHPELLLLKFFTYLRGVLKSPLKSELLKALHFLSFSLDGMFSNSLMVLSGLC